MIIGPEPMIRTLDGFDIYPFLLTLLCFILYDKLMKTEAEKWLTDSEYDLEVARSLFQFKHYRYVIFMCHLSSEKALKAYIAEVTETFPPYIHNLPKLAETAGLDLPERLKSFIYLASDESVLSRYPSNLRVYTKEKANEYLTHTAELITWLKHKLKSEK